MPADCSAPYPCDETSHPEAPFYCQRHARGAGLPVHPDGYGVICRGFRLVDRPDDFTFDHARPRGQRFVVAA